MTFRPSITTTIYTPQFVSPQKQLKREDQLLAETQTLSSVCASMENNSTVLSSHDSNENTKSQWKAEDAIGGNAEALQALRELIIFPLHYSRQAQKLGLKVKFFPFISILVYDTNICYSKSVIMNLWVTFLANLVSGFASSGREGCCYMVLQAPER